MLELAAACLMDTQGHCATCRNWEPIGYATRGTCLAVRVEGDSEVESSKLTPHTRAFLISHNRDVAVQLVTESFFGCTSYRVKL